MTTLSRLTGFKSATGTNTSTNTNTNTTDFVSTDSAALASHMNECAHSRSRFFNLHAALELAHNLLFSRMVTAALLAALLVSMVSAI